MSESVWLRQVEDGLVKEIKSTMTYRDDYGNKVPVPRVLVRKPDVDFIKDYMDKNKTEEVVYPVVTISNTFSSPDKKRFLSSDNDHVVVSVTGNSAVVEDRAVPYKLHYQVDIYAEYQDDIDAMELSWMSKHRPHFMLKVVDNGGTPRECPISISGSVQRSDKVIEGKRLFRAIINYSIRVEIDENTRYNKNIVNDVSLNM